MIGDVFERTSGTDPFRDRGADAALRERLLGAAGRLARWAS